MMKGEQKMTNDRTTIAKLRRTRRPRELRPIRRMPELYQVVIECRDEAQQREIYERLKDAGVRVRLHVL
jgi:hypothetical protein